MAETQILRNRNFATYAADGTPTTLDGYLVVPNTNTKVTKASLGDGTPVARVQYGNQLCGPHNPGYHPEPGTVLTASLGANSMAINYNKDLRPPIVRIQIGSERLSESATPATEPKILAQWKPTETSAPNFASAVVTATVPESYDPETDDPIFVVYYCTEGVSGTRPGFYVASPSFTETVEDPPVDNPPTIPTDLRTTALASDKITLAWTASTDDHGVTGYRVLQDGVVMDTVTGTSYAAEGLTPDMLYLFNVRAVDTIGQLSPPAVLYARTNAVTSDSPPSTPSGLEANKTTNTVTLSWTAGTDDVSVAGYRVYRNGTQVNTALVTGTTFTDTGLTPATAYSYTVRTQDSAGQLSAPTAALAVTTDGLPTDPEPDSDSEMAQRVADFVGAGSDPNFLALAKQSVAVMTAMVRSYTRGNGFAGTEPNAEVAAVIVTASARLAANPEQLLHDVGSVWVRSSFQGFNLAELYVLNRYRVRAQ